MNKYLKFTSLSFVLASVLFTGCGGGGGSSAIENPNTTVSGVVSDGLINGSTVKLMNGAVVVAEAKTNTQGVFSISAELDESIDYLIEATGGIDTDTNEDFTGVVLKTLLSMYDEDKESTVVSPFTSLVAEKVADGDTLDDAILSIQKELGLDSIEDVSIAPHKDIKLQKVAMQLSLLVKSGKSFDSIAEGLYGEDGIDNLDIDKIIPDTESNTRILLKASIDTLNDTDIKSINDAIEAYTQLRYIRIIRAYSEADLTDDKALENIFKLAESFYDENEELTESDLTASLTGLTLADLTDDSFDVTNYKVRKVDTTLSFSDTMKVLYYTITNPITNNDQLLAYDYETKKASVVNTDLILKSKVFIYEGEKDSDKVVYNTKKYGLYLDPTQDKETRVLVTDDSSSTYTFYSNNALMKFNPAKPSETSYIFKSSDIPQSLQDKGITKLGDTYTVYENIVDTDNSYISLKGYDSLADLVKGEDEDDKKQVDITIRLEDSKSVQGKTLRVIRNSEEKTDSVLVSLSDIYTPSSDTPTFKLVKYSKDLTTKTDITDGEFFYATSNSTHVYLFKEGSSQLWAFSKSDDSIIAVTGVSLAGEYSYDTHAKASGHGSNSALIDGGSTLSGSNKRLSDGVDAYLSFNYDLFANVGSAFIFGEFGAYKNSQIFKLTATSGSKIFDNGDGVDNSFEEDNTEVIKGHVNLIATANNKIFIELGWYNGNDGCLAYYPYPGAGTKCINVKYGSLDTEVSETATELTMLKYDVAGVDNDKDMAVTGLPYYIARRIAPVANGNKLYISLFAGGTSTEGYEYEQYVFDLNSDTTDIKKEGRTYFLKTAERGNGIYEGTVISWDKDTQLITDSESNELSSTSDINGHAGKSISGETNGVPLAGIGTLAMLKNNTAGVSHSFELFALDIEKKELQYIDLAPYGGWIYE